MTGLLRPMAIGPGAPVEVIDHWAIPHWRPREDGRRIRVWNAGRVVEEAESLTVGQHGE